MGQPFDVTARYPSLCAIAVGIAYEDKPIGSRMRQWSSSRKTLEPATWRPGKYHIMSFSTAVQLEILSTTHTTFCMNLGVPFLP